MQKAGLESVQGMQQAMQQAMQQMAAAQPKDDKQDKKP